MKGRVLIIAGSDSGGGAGIQADIKTVTALGGFAMTAITALTAQNTIGVHGVFPVEPDFIRQQIDVVVSDLGVDAVKTGMLHSTPVIECVADALERLPGDVPVVVDPVMVAKGGSALLEQDAVAALRERLIPLATVITPNLPEAGVLLGEETPSLEKLEEAAERLRKLGPQAALLKGGHLEGDVLIDILKLGEDDLRTWSSNRIDTVHTHGTGCTLASAIATGLAQGVSIVDAVDRARIYVRQAIATAPGFGAGHGPLNHAHTLGKT